MTKIIFAIFWTALYAVLLAAIGCFIAWGVPDVTAWDAGDRAAFLFITACGFWFWGVLGLAVWELRK